MTGVLICVVLTLFFAVWFGIREWRLSVALRRLVEASSPFMPRYVLGEYMRPPVHVLEGSKEFIEAVKRARALVGPERRRNER